MFDLPFVRLQARFLRIGTGLALPAFLGLSSCATAGSSRYQALDADFARSAPPGVISPQKERDPVRAPVLERGAFIRAVLRDNPSIESARQSWRAALARVRQAGAFEDPMVDLGVAPLSVASSDAPLGYEVGIRQQLPWFGKRSLEASIVSAEAEAAKSDHEAVKRELALSALTLYNEYFVAARSLEINKAHIKLMQVMRDSATAQFGSGHGSAQDSLQAEVELTHMEHSAVILESQREVLVAQMNELLHRDPELPLPPPPAELSIPGALDVDVVTPRTQSEAVEQRPDIAAARQRIKAEQARSERAERDAYPDFTVSTSYNSMWDMPEHRWMVGLGFNLPIQSGRRAGAADEARAMKAHLESEVASMSDAARTQLFVSLKQLKESEHVLRLFESRLLPVARDQIDAARAGFITSQNSFMAVIEAERNLRGVELEYQMKRVEAVQRRGELDHALGRIPGLDAQELNP